MLLTQDQTMVRDAMREFVQSEITPHAAPFWCPRQLSRLRALLQGTPPCC